MNSRGKYIAAFIAGFAVSAVTASAQGIFKRVEAALIMKDLSNAFLVSAVLLGGIGLLTVCGSGGAFDILAYSSKRFFSLFRFNTDNGIKRQDYYEYRRAKSEKRSPQWFLVITGTFFLLLSIVFTLFFYLIY
jgi:hypothetical protein